MFEPRLRKVLLKAGARRDALSRRRARRCCRRRRVRARTATPSSRAVSPAEKVHVRGNGFPDARGSRLERRPARAARHLRGAPVDPLRRQDRRGQRHRAPARRPQRASRRACRDRRARTTVTARRARRARRRRTRDAGPDPHAAGDRRAAARPLPAGRRLRPRLGRRELRHRRGRGGRGGDARHRLRSLRHRRASSGTAKRSSFRTSGTPSSKRCATCSRTSELRERLARGGVAAARRTSWDHVTDVQEEIYRDVASRTAATKLSTEGS